MKTLKITIDEFREFVGNHVFTAKFYKLDGTERVLNGRLKVTKFIKGTNPEATEKRNATLKDQNMITVFEMNTGNYRTLNLDTLFELRANGKVLTA